MKANNQQEIIENLSKSRIPAVIKKVVTVLMAKKAEKIVILKLKGINKITDFMLICSGNSTRQNHALSNEVQVRLRKESKQKAFSVEGEKAADWILLDYIDFIVHIFTPESRNKYLIEKLWMDAKRYNFYTD